MGLLNKLKVVFNEADNIDKVENTPRIVCPKMPQQ